MIYCDTFALMDSTLMFTVLNTMSYFLWGPVFSQWQNNITNLIASLQPLLEVYLVS